MIEYVAEVSPQYQHTRYKRVLVRGADDVIKLLDKQRRLNREHFFSILLDARHGVIKKTLISIGILNCSLVHPREVFYPAIKYKACAIIVAHNHPSGDPEPSEEDITITKRLVEVGDLLGIPVLDHVILAKDGCVSFQQRNKLRIR